MRPQKTGNDEDHAGEESIGEGERNKLELDKLWGLFNLYLMLIPVLLLVRPGKHFY